MQICVRFDEQTLSQYEQRGARSFFYIHWRHEDIVYPGLNWTDFGAVILGWWMMDATNLWYGSKKENLLFMDGDFCISVHREGELLKFSAQEFATFECSIHEFISVLVETANTVINELKRVNVDQNGQKSLSYSIEQLSKLQQVTFQF